MKTWAQIYNLCDENDDCERGFEHEGDHGLAIREGFKVVKFIDTEADRDQRVRGTNPVQTLKEA